MSYRENEKDDENPNDSSINMNRYNENSELDDNIITEDVLESLVISDAREDKWRSKTKRKTEDRRTTESVLDLSTAKVLLKFLNKGIIEYIGGIISTGKEANVYFAKAGSRLKETMEKPQDYIAAKIYRTRSLNFKRIKQYIVVDPRFHRVGKKAHQIMKTWAEKEYKNYKRCWKADISVPEVYLVKRNILLMQFIGIDNYPAPVLKYADVEDYELVYDQVYDMIKNMYQKAKLVHADLSEYNILYMNGKVWLIDVGQAILSHHPYTLKYLVRDLNNFKNYFESKRILVPSVKDMMHDICEDREEGELLLYLE